MTISDAIKNLKAIKEKFGDLEVFISEISNFDDGLGYTTTLNECTIRAQSQRDGLIVVVKRRDEDVL